MPRGSSLSAKEQGIIIGMRESGSKILHIAASLNRHRNCIYNFLKNPSGYGSNRRSGRKTNIDDRCKRRIWHLAVDNLMSSGGIKAQLGLQISRNRIVQILHENKFIKYTSMVHKPKLLERHIKARLEFANKHQFWAEEWHNVVFSDEKKFNLDGPDNSKKYWRDSRQERRSCYKRGFGGGTLMVWAAFCYKGKTPMCFISTRMNASMYVELLDSELIEFAGNIYGDNWTYQQDNAAIHTAKVTKNFFNDRKIPLLQWPALSPDLNPIEDLWGILSARVFKNGRQFETVRHLKSAIELEWANINVTTIQSLVNSMPMRLNLVLQHKGTCINY